MSGHRCDVLAIVDVATLLSEHADASKDADAPTVIDGRHIYVLSPGEIHQVDSGYHPVGMVAVDSAAATAELLQGLAPKP